MLNSFEFTTNYHPCELLLIGDEAFPVLVSTNGQVLIAASCYGKGRTVVVSHGGILKDSNCCFVKGGGGLLIGGQAWHWASRHGKEKVLFEFPGNQVTSVAGVYFAGSERETGEDPCKLTDLKENLSVYCCKAYCAEEVEKIHEFVSRSSGLLVGGQEWSWAAANADENAIAEFLGNSSTAMVAVMGGETDISAWQSTIHQYPAPRAELATENIILTVPAADVHHMDNPESLLSIWNKMMNAIAILVAIPATFPRPKRMVADVQISHGKYNN
ncbi:TRPM8 channel-associated factor 2-like [Phoenicopterus ruber ruber]